MTLQLPQKRSDTFDCKRCSQWAERSQALAEQLSSSHLFTIQRIRLRIYDAFGGERGQEEAFWSVLLGLTGQERLPCCPRHIQAVIRRFERLQAIRLNNKKLVRFNPQTDVILIETDPRRAARRICAIAWGEGGTILDMVSCLVPPPSDTPLRFILPRRAEDASSFPLPISA